MTQVNIHGKNMEVNERHKEYIQKKIGKLDHHLPSVSTIEVEVSQEDTKSQENRYVVQVTLNVKGQLLRGQKRASTVLAAVDTVAEAVERQIERFKGKRYQSEQRPPVTSISIEERDGGTAEAAPEDAAPTPQVARVKRFPMKPMPPEEAIDQMELLGHDFFLFYNVQSNQFNVVYRRRDGTYGLIEPETD